MQGSIKSAHYNHIDKGMLDRTICNLRQAVVHLAGREEGFELSDETLDLTDGRLTELMKEYFLSGFTAPEYFAFASEDGKPNPLREIADAVFNDPQTFLSNAADIARHHHACVASAAVRGGDLFIAFFTDIVIDGESSEALGIFKSEEKETYLQLHRLASGRLALKAEQGINIQKLDKGCLIFNKASDQGYRACIVDRGSKISTFWKDEFLKVTGWEDAFHHTQNFMNLTREYLVDQLQEDFNVSKADQIDLLNRSVDFFKGRDTFQKQQFEAEVLEDPNVIESFRKFSEDYRSQSALDIIDNFEISAQAVKRQARIFKSVLKLDKNFHVYIHGNRELIEKGFDENKGKHYYKIFFDKET